VLSIQIGLNFYDISYLVELLTDNPYM
jgi:hypothetical protein